MPKQLYAIYVADPQTRNAFLRSEYATKLRSENTRMTLARLNEVVEEQAQMVGGDLEQVIADALHSVADAACPDGRPNCRNCGDPDYKASCAAAGHCPLCGTRHGVGPDALLATRGLAVTPLAALPTPDEQWDPATKAFVARPPESPQV